MDSCKLPFNVGQLVEARSFLVGFRGAWFRCKIKQVRRRKGELVYAVEYCDFPEEKVEWIKLRQKSGKSKSAKLMIRPSFPPIYNEGQVPDISGISDVVVIVNNAWKKGDLVDWWADDCYWSGRLTEVLGPDKFQLKLFPPPAGEGLSYEVSCSKEFRPSLDWSPEHGWTFPIPVGSKGHCSCARLVKPGDQGGSENLAWHPNYEKIKDHGTSIFSRISTGTPPSDMSEKISERPLSITACMVTQPLEINKHLNAIDGGIVTNNCFDSASGLQIGNASTKVTGNAVAMDSNVENDSSKKMRIDKSIYLNTMASDTIEAAILDLEELVNRVKWTKNILQFGLPLPNTVNPSWKFLEHETSSQK